MEKDYSLFDESHFTKLFPPDFHDQSPEDMVYWLSTQIPAEVTEIRLHVTSVDSMQELLSVVVYCRRSGIALTVYHHNREQDSVPQGVFLPQKKIGARDRTSLYTWRGKAQSLRDWSNELGIPYGTLHMRIARLGWTVDEAFSTPKGKYCK